MDRTIAPYTDYFGDVSDEDWAAFTDAYLDLVEDPVDVRDDPRPAVLGPATGRAPRERGAPLQRPKVECSRQLVPAF